MRIKQVLSSAKVLELESLVGFNEKEMDEMLAIAKEQQELVEIIV